MTLLSTKKVAEIIGTTPVNVRKLVFKNQLRSEYPGKGLFTSDAVTEYQERDSFILTWDNGIDSFRENYGLDLDKAIRQFEYWSQSDANSHTIYPATVEILFNRTVIRSYNA